MQDYQTIYEATAELSRLLLEEGALDTVLQGIAGQAVAVIPACEEAGVTLENNGQIRIRTTTGTRAEKVDAYQYEIDEGPCVAAADVKHPVLVEDLATDPRWPRFGRFASELGIKSSYSIPMKMAGEVIGILNLYSVDDPFGPEDERTGAMFAQHAAAAVRHTTAFAKTREIIANLHRALETRDIIGAAVGIIMHRDGTSMDEAFDRLKKLSQRENVRLRDIAERMLGEFESVSASSFERKVQKTEP